MNTNDQGKPAKKFIFKRSGEAKRPATPAPQSGAGPAPIKPKTSLSKISFRKSPVAPSPLSGQRNKTIPQQRPMQQPRPMQQQPISSLKKTPMARPIANPSPLTSKRTNGADDFEAFRQKKMQKKRLQKSKGQKAESQRYERKEGITGDGERYQDQKLADAINTRPRDLNCGKGSKYQDHRIGDGFSDFLPLTAGEGENYQDHRIGNALDAPLPKGAGQGNKYQDHRLGPGLKNKVRSSNNAKHYQDHRHGGASVTQNTKKKFTFKKR